MSKKKIKYHQFSEMISSDIRSKIERDTTLTLNDFNDKILAIVKYDIPSMLPYIAERYVIYTVCFQRNNVQVYAYSQKFIQRMGCKFTNNPYTYYDLMQFEVSKINNPQSFIPLGAAYDKELPDLEIYFDDVQYEGYAEFKSLFPRANIDNGFIDVDMVTENALDYMPMYIQPLAESYYVDNRDSSSAIPMPEPVPLPYIPPHDTNISKKTKLMEIDITMKDTEIKYGPKNPNTTYRQSYEENVHRKYKDISDYRLEGGALLLVFNDNKVKGIPLTEIKEFFITDMEDKKDATECV